MNENRELWNEYRRTWKAFAACLDEWQKSTAPDDALRAAVESARTAHNLPRDRLAEHLTSREHRVRNTARLMWEFAGKPDGTAEADWQKAEAVWK